MVFLGLKLQENRKKTGRNPKENQKKTKRKPKENQKKAKRKPKENQKENSTIMGGWCSSPSGFFWVLLAFLLVFFWCSSGVLLVFDNTEEHQKNPEEPRRTPEEHQKRNRRHVRYCRYTNRNDKWLHLGSLVNDRSIDDEKNENKWLKRSEVISNWSSGSVEEASRGQGTPLTPLVFFWCSSGVLLGVTAESQMAEISWLKRGWRTSAWSWIRISIILNDKLEFR